MPIGQHGWKKISEWLPFRRLRSSNKMGDKLFLGNCKLKERTQSENLRKEKKSSEMTGRQKRKEK